MTKYCVIKINEEYTATDSRYIKIIGVYSKKEDAIDNILNVINWKLDNTKNKYINYINAVSNKKQTFDYVHKNLNDNNIINHLDIDLDISLIYRILEMNSVDN